MRRTTQMEMQKIQSDEHKGLGKMTAAIRDKVILLKGSSRDKKLALSAMLQKKKSLFLGIIPSCFWWW